MPSLLIGFLIYAAIHFLCSYAAMALLVHCFSRKELDAESFLMALLFGPLALGLWLLCAWRDPRLTVGLRWLLR
jgi:hypothetical protein